MSANACLPARLAPAHDRLRNPLVQDTLAQLLHCARIAEEFCKAHKNEATRIGAAAMS